MIFVPFNHVTQQTEIEVTGVLSLGDDTVGVCGSSAHAAQRGLSVHCDERLALVTIGLQHRHRRIHVLLYLWAARGAAGAADRAAAGSAARVATARPPAA